MISILLVVSFVKTKFSIYSPFHLLVLTCSKLEFFDFVMKSAFPCKKSALFARFYFLHLSKHTTSQLHIIKKIFLDCQEGDRTVQINFFSKRIFKNRLNLNNLQAHEHTIRTQIIFIPRKVFFDDIHRTTTSYIYFALC